jgi:hypothetical protein
MTKLPTTLLRDVHWCFALEVPKSRDEMLEDACFFANFMDVGDPKADLTRQLPFADVRLRYEYGRRPRRAWDEEEDEDAEEWRPSEAEVRVVAGPLSVLTGADLLWDLHLALAAMLNECEGHFLEGLELESTGGGGEPPTYRVRLGS